MQQYGNANELTAVLAGPFGSVGSAVKLTGVTLPAADWKGAASPYFQVVEVEGISVSSRIDLQPDLQQLQLLRSAGIGLYAENEEGVVTVYALGGKPQEDLTLQATAMEVVA